MQIYEECAMSNFFFGKNNEKSNIKYSSILN